MPVPQINLTTLALLLAAFALVMIAASLIAEPRGRRLRSSLLAGFLGAIACSLANFALFTSSAVTRWPGVAFLGNTVGLAAPSLLWLYGQSLMYRDFALQALQARHLWHAALPLGVAAYTWHGYWRLPTEQQLRYLRGTEGPFGSLWIPITIYVVILGYLIANRFTLARFRGRLAEIYSDVDRHDLRWFSRSVNGLLVIWVGSLVQTLLSEASASSTASRLATMLLSLTALAISVDFLYHALRGAPPGLPDDLPESPRQLKYGQQRLEGEALTRLREALVRHMEHDRPYLDDSLSLETLAGGVPTFPRELSQVINRSFGKSFADFVNGYRIEHAKEQLLAHPTKTVSSVQFESGFSTKSAFYSAFRNATGTTPTAYRKSASSSS